jgi:hypothetical protein
MGSNTGYINSDLLVILCQNFQADIMASEGKLTSLTLDKCVRYHALL